jgi:hypothetical protein
MTINFKDCCLKIGVHLRFGKGKCHSLSLFSSRPDLLDKCENQDCQKCCVQVCSKSPRVSKYLMTFTVRTTQQIEHTGFGINQTLSSNPTPAFPRLVDWCSTFLGFYLP